MPSELEDLDSKNRNFICSCRKAYLSYAALFTHIKQKHGGKVIYSSLFQGSWIDSKTALAEQKRSTKEEWEDVIRERIER